MIFAIRTLTVLGVVALAILIFVAVRSLLYVRNTNNLKDISLTFPREYTVGSTASPSYTYVSLGDSTVSGVGVSTHQETLPHRIAMLKSRDYLVKVRNFGVSGAVLKDVLEKQLPQIPSGHIDLLTISISGNDATRSTTLSDFDQDLRALLTAVAAKDIEHILITTTPDFAITPALPSLIRTKVKKHATSLQKSMQSVVADYQTVRIVDIYARGTLSKEEYASDGFHPNAAGYQKWATIFEAAL